MRLLLDTHILLWALIEPTLSAWREERHFIKTATTPLREIVNAILYQNRTGCQWDLLPHDFPPSSTVYDYYSAWHRDGTDRRIHDLLRRQVRRAVPRSWTVLGLAERGLYARWRWRRITRLGWQPLLRLNLEAADAPTCAARTAEVLALVRDTTD